MALLDTPWLLGSMSQLFFLFFLISILLLPDHAGCQQMQNYLLESDEMRSLDESFLVTMVIISIHCDTMLQCLIADMDQVYIL